jgi:hypothetical protein
MSHNLGQGPGFLWCMAVGQCRPVSIRLYSGLLGGYQNVSTSNIIRNVSAYGIYTNTIYDLPSTVPLRPDLGVRFNYFSGGNVKKTSGTIGTYVQLTPGPDHFAYDQYIIGQTEIFVLYRLCDIF